MVVNPGLQKLLEGYGSQSRALMGGLAHAATASSATVSDPTTGGAVAPSALSPESTSTGTTKTDSAKALQAKRTILFLQALQRARTAPEGSLSARTLARLHAGGGRLNGVGLAGTHANDARQMDPAQVATLMSGLDELRKRIGGGQSNGIAPIYSQPFS